MSDAKEMARFEALAEEAYGAMYDVRPHGAKDCYEDACYNLSRAIGIAKMRGLAADIERLTKRLEHIEAVYNSQFRHVGR
ncbi:MAG: hypothetical protein HY243_17420 [Proteobacteria bacterium]|nr:hypothetical protein [Pseudomonadota bacterium]